MDPGRELGEEGRLSPSRHQEEPLVPVETEVGEIGDISGAVDVSIDDRSFDLLLGQMSLQGLDAGMQLSWSPLLEDDQPPFHEATSKSLRSVVSRGSKP